MAEDKEAIEIQEETDTKTEKILLETLKYYYPNASYITEESGKIEYSINPNYNGLAEFTVNLSDDGGIENGGDDTSENQTFSVLVGPVDAL